MKTLNFWRYAALVFCMLIQFSCDNEDEEASEIYVYFTEDALNVTEGDTEMMTIPIQVFATGKIQDDLQITYTIQGDGGDRVTDQSGGAITLEKGFEAYRGYITLMLGNNEEADGDAALRIELASPNPKVIFGLGGADKTNNVLQLTVTDDECSGSIDDFSGALVNTTEFGVHDITATIDGNVAALQGDLISYSALGANLEITLTPETEGGIKGSATFEDFDAGVDSDGYAYYFSQIGEGTYDICSGEIRVAFEIYYFDDGWVYWYSSDNVFSIPE